MSDFAQLVLERIVSVAGILLCAHAMTLILNDVGSDQPELGEANLRFQLMSLAIFGLAIACMIPQIGVVKAMTLDNPIYALLIGLALASVLWSHYPGISARRALALCLTTGFIYFLVIRFHPLSLLGLVFGALVVAALLSLILAVVQPALAIHHQDVHEGLWRGVFGHKNVAGRMMSLAIVVGLLLLMTGKGRASVTLAGIASALTVLLMSGSKTALIATVGSLAVIPLVFAVRTRKILPSARWILVVAVGLLVGGAGVVTFEPLVTMSGGEVTLSGRTRLWSLAIDVGTAHPLVGAGFRAFWMEDGGAAQVFSALSWGEGNIGNGHNGFLDVWLELGFAGIAIVVLILARVVQQVASQNWWQDPTTLCLAVITAHTVLYSLTERVLLEHSDLSWVLFSAFVLYANRRMAWARRLAISPLQRRLTGSTLGEVSGPLQGVGRTLEVSGELQQTPMPADRREGRPRDLERPA